MTTSAASEGLRYLFGSSADTEHDTIQREPRWEYFTLNTWRYLADRVAYDESLHERFEEWRDQEIAREPYGIAYRSGLAAAEMFVTDVLGVPESDVFTVNTYNYESSFLEDVLQYVQWTDPETMQHYALIQRHLGGDVRGNYSDPVPFEIIVEPTAFGVDGDTAVAYCSEDHGYEIRIDEVYSIDDDRYLDASDDDALVATNPETGERDYLCPICRTSGKYVPLAFGLPYPSY